jgi:Skp family chaperone for outer membrane proteins
MKKLLSLAAASLVLVSAQSFAEPHQRPHHPRDPGVNQRQHMQGERIKQGVRSGELTRQETGGLMQERRSIRQEERAYKSDGRMTKNERKDLHQDLSELSHDIYNEKHDGETRPRVQ